MNIMENSKQKELEKKNYLMSNPKNILIVSTSERSTLELSNVVKEIKKRNHNFFYLYSNDISTQFPTISLDKFVYDTNIKNFTSKYISKSLGNISLPFIPDILLVSRENWEPEKSMFIEFKQLGSLICCLENSSWVLSSIETKLELHSRKRFPTNLIDVFFDHSNWTFDNKKNSSWVTHKSKIVGIPKYDNISNVVPYKKSKPIIIIYGSMNKLIHSQILEIAEKVSKKLSNDYEIFYKPHPMEFIDFKNEFSENQNQIKHIPNIKIIKDETLYQKIVKSSDFNIIYFSSVIYYPLILNKKIILLDLFKIGLENDLDLTSFKEKRYNFWKNVFGFSNFEEAEKVIGENYINNSIKRNKQIYDKILEENIEYDEEFKWITSNNKIDNSSTLKYFTQYPDFNSSSRIVDEIENLFI